MGGAKADKVKGRLKEAAGALTGDEKLKKSGKLDQAAGEVKETLDKVVDETRDLLGRKRRRDR